MTFAAHRHNVNVLLKS